VTHLRQIMLEELRRRNYAESTISMGQHVGTMSEEERLEFMSREMQKVHPGLLRNLEGAVSKIWQADPWAGGVISAHAPTQLTSATLWLRRCSARIGRQRFRTSVRARDPDWPRTSRMAQKRSELDLWLATTCLPSAVISSADRRLSQAKPYFGVRLCSIPPRGRRSFDDEVTLVPQQWPMHRRAAM
jgi:hypothetical protein